MTDESLLQQADIYHCCCRTTRFSRAGNLRHQPKTLLALPQRSSDSHQSMPAPSAFAKNAV